MKQMITRLDDELHARLKERAAVESVSVNELMIRVLTAVLDGTTSRGAIRERARATGRLVLPEPPARTPHKHDVVEISAEFGTTVSEALDAERSAR